MGTWPVGLCSLLVRLRSQFGTVVGVAVAQLRKDEPPPTWALVAFAAIEGAASALAHASPTHPDQPPPEGHVACALPNRIFSPCCAVLHLRA